MRPGGSACVGARGARRTSNIEHRASASSFYPDNGDGCRWWSTFDFSSSPLPFTIIVIFSFHYYCHLCLLPGLTRCPSKVQVKSTFNPVLLPDSLQNRRNQHSQVCTFCLFLQTKMHFHFLDALASLDFTLVSKVSLWAFEAFKPVFIRQKT